MEREEVPPGRAVVREGDDAKRFYVVLSGLFAVSQEDLGPRRVLRPGDYFGEVGLAMNIPRTASVRALTPAVVGELRPGVRSTSCCARCSPMTFSRARRRRSCRRPARDAAGLRHSRGVGERLRQLRDLAVTLPRAGSIASTCLDRTNE